MKRDIRLQGLSSDHHQALVLGRDLAEGRTPWTPEAAAALGETFDRELEPHFRVEEELLLPALRSLGELELVTATEADHAFLRSKVAAARGGDGEAARAFGERLRDHVRFEERELFVRCEERLSDAVLDEVARRAPRPDRGE